MTTQKHRENPLFLRDGFPSDERSDIPIIHDSESITAERLRSITWIPCSSARKNDSRSCDRIGVHHFVGDEHIPNIYENPERTLEKYSQYSILITPDNSTYREMPRPIQICAVFRSRWVGAFWQSHGLTAIPSVTWSGPESFTFVSMVLNLLLSLRCLLLDVKEGMRPRPSLCVGIMCYWSVFIRVSFYVLGPHLSEWPLRPHR